ncbi:8-oxo-dGTP diphosphatase [Nakamurella panacisegetis]|uniref:8-oxo-dGTP diphosphatase n=1 Tax=Nakamurella panacisegetis TaxID=1090615 RepID=A0A1H0HWK4_9ACTN|nr:bifunctional NUDIX hydrolase/histidine phosphatase family protein [Nakamurella panacisegetis]SDO23559.1 8-oxo-dGTP diphosphatase [Nakamurella panacisegetis]
MRNDASAVRAAGAVLWRPSVKHGIRIALVHRPRYDDWSLPKGKADSGESAPVTAWREVWEETGFRSVLGRALTTVSYAVAGGPKTVQYFAARALGGSFTANKEVDRLEWLSPGAARALMSYDFDKAVLDTFGLERPDLRGVLLVRHARAGHRESFDGQDILRPLDAKGRRQAQALVAELLPFGPGPVHSAPAERCRATVAPLARTLGQAVAIEPLLAEESYRDDPAAARRRLVELAGSEAVWPERGAPVHPARPAAGASIRGSFAGGVPSAKVSATVVACSQGGVIPGVVKSLAGRSDVPLPRIGTPKGAFWFLSFEGRRLVQADAYPSPPV